MATSKNTLKSWFNNCNNVYPNIYSCFHFHYILWGGDIGYILHILRYCIFTKMKVFAMLEVSKYVDMHFLNRIYITKTCLFKYTENFITKK